MAGVSGLDSAGRRHYRQNCWIYELTGCPRRYRALPGTAMPRASANDMPNGAPWCDAAMYPAAEAARLVGLSSPRVRRWLKGYEYQYTEPGGTLSVHRQAPVVHRQGTAGTSYASFLDLIDLLFVKQFLERGLSLQKLRKGFDEATRILGASHFARQTFFTDGRDIYLQVRDDGDAILELLSGGQWVIAPIIRQIAERIDFDEPTGLARRWYPMRDSRLIVLDPLVSFGRPSIAGRGIATANVYDFFVAENRSVRRVCSWQGLKREEVEMAVQFEEALVA